MKKVLLMGVILLGFTTSAYAQLDATPKEQRLELGSIKSKQVKRNINIEERALPFGQLFSHYRPESNTVFLEFIKFTPPLPEEQVAAICDFFAPLRGKRVELILPTDTPSPRFINVTIPTRRQTRLYVFEKALIAWRYEHNSLVDSVVIGTRDCYRYYNE